MLRRYVSHIPARHFKMVRYYGFMASRKRGSLLLKVYVTPEMTVREKPKRPGFAMLMKGCIEWQKSDSFRPYCWINAPEKWFLA